MSSKKALVLLADGTEEMEFVIPVDVLRRAEITVTTAGVGLKNGTYAECSRGVKILPDVEAEHIGVSWNQLLWIGLIEDFDAIIIPGGVGGAKILSESVLVQKLVSSFYERQKIVAFICAGTLVAKSAGVPEGHKVTSHPSVKEQLEDVYKYSEDRVVVDQNVITSRGPGTAFLFALTIVEQLVGKQVVDKISPPMILSNAL
ncbi:class I glutamine amidotransferase-like protein [Umbelopsis sp. AD052]|nr:class I glutamine amidotransferase-like protein [Umbelopsis sp. AD052]